VTEPRWLNDTQQKTRQWSNNRKHLNSRFERRLTSPKNLYLTATPKQRLSHKHGLRATTTEGPERGLGLRG